MSQLRNYNSYHGSTTLFHKEYVREQSRQFTRYIDLVLLVKKWAHCKNIPLRSFLIELIVAYAIMDTKQDEEFPFFFEVCFRDIQAFCDGKEIIPVNWDKYFTANDITARNAYQTGLLIVDPADPSVNLAEKMTNDEKAFIYSETSKAISKIHQERYYDVYR